MHIFVKSKIQFLQKVGYSTGKIGFEPTTIGFGDQHSTTELLSISWDSRNRTYVCWYQKPMPYHLAISQNMLNYRHTYV